MKTQNRVTRVLRILIHIWWYLTLGLVSFLGIAFVGTLTGTWDAMNTVNFGIELEIEGLEAENELLVNVTDSEGRQYPVEPIKAKGILDFDVRGGYLGNLTIPFVTCYLFACAMGLWGIFQLRKLFDNLARGEYFDKSNAIRVRNLAYVVFGFVALRLIIQIVFESTFSVQTGSNITVTGVQIGISPLLLIGLFILVLSQVLKEAATLKAEQDLTV